MTAFPSPSWIKDWHEEYKTGQFLAVVPED